MASSAKMYQLNYKKLPKLNTLKKTKTNGLRFLNLPCAITLVGEAFAPLIEQGFEKSSLECDDDVDVDDRPCWLGLEPVGHWKIMIKLKNISLRWYLEQLSILCN